MGGGAGTAGTAASVPLLTEVRQGFAVPYFSKKTFAFAEQLLSFADVRLKPRSSPFAWHRAACGVSRHTVTVATLRLLTLPLSAFCKYFSSVFTKVDVSNEQRVNLTTDTTEP